MASGLQFDIKVDDKGNVAIDNLNRNVKKLGVETQKTSKFMQGLTFGKGEDFKAGKILNNLIGIGGAYKAINLFQSMFNEYLKDSAGLSGAALLKHQEISREVQAMSGYWKDVKKNAGEVILSGLSEILKSFNLAPKLDETEMSIVELDAKIAEIEKNRMIRHQMEDLQLSKSNFVGQQAALARDLGDKREIENLKEKISLIQYRDRQDLQTRNALLKIESEQQKQDEINKYAKEHPTKSFGNLTDTPHSDKMAILMGEAKLEQEIEDTQAKNESRKKLRGKLEIDRLKAEKELRMQNMRTTIFTFSQIADQFKGYNKTMFAMAKGLAVADATMNAVGSINKTLEQGGAFAMPLAIATGVFATTQVAAILATSYEPKYARGSHYTPGGNAIVGENGPEMVNLPRGSSVIPNYRMETINNSGTTIVIHGNIIGEDAYVRNNLIPAIDRHISRRR